MRRVLALAGLAALVLSPPAAASAQVPFFNRALFLAALSSSSTVTFEGLVPNDQSVPYGIPSTFGALTLNADPGAVAFFVNGPNFAGGTTSLGTGASFVVSAFAGPNNFTVTTPGGFRAFGLDFLTPNGVSLTLDGTPLLLTPSATGFVGFISPTAIMSVNLVSVGSANDDAFYDNLTTGTPLTPTAAVPEPMTLALVGTGLLLVGGIARRRRPTA